MQINLPNVVENLVLEKAAAAGYGEDVAAYVAHLIEADEPLPLSEDQRKQSEAIIERGEADIAAGRTQDMREAMLQLGEKRGYSNLR